MVWDNIDKYMNYGDYFQRKETLHLLGHKFYNLFLISVSLRTSVHTFPMCVLVTQSCLTLRSHGL